MISRDRATAIADTFPLSGGNKALLVDMICESDDRTISDIPTRSDGNTKALDDALQEIHTAAAIVLSSDRLIHLNTLHQRELESIPRRVHDAGCAARALASELSDYQRLVEVWRKRSDAKTDRITELEETLNGLCEHTLTAINRLTTLGYYGSASVLNEARNQACAALSPAPAQPASPDLGVESIVSQLREIVTDQKNDEAMLSDDGTAPEAYLRHLLRDLHSVVERAIAGLAQPATAATRPPAISEAASAARLPLHPTVLCAAPPSPAAREATEDDEAIKCPHGKPVDRSLSCVACLNGNDDFAPADVLSGSIRADGSKDVDGSESPSGRSAGAPIFADGYSSNHNPIDQEAEDVIQAFKNAVEIMDGDRVSVKWSEIRRALALDAAREGKR